MTLRYEASAEALDTEALEIIDALEAHPDEKTIGRFDEWMERSPEHAARMNSLAAQLNTLQVIRPSKRLHETLDGTTSERAQSQHSQVVQLTKPGRASARSPADGTTGDGDRTVIWKWLGGVAASVLIVAMSITLVQWSRTWPTEYRTADRSRSISLSDGSTLVLASRSLLRVHETPLRRELQLKSGRAFFSIHHDPDRPFTLTTPFARIEDLGTRFNVSADSEGTRVALSEGELFIATAHSNVQLSGQQYAEVDRRGHIVSIETAQTPSARWQTFTNASLGEIARAFNDENRSRGIEFEVEEQLANRNDYRKSGALNLADPQSWVNELQKDGSLKVTRTLNLIEIRLSGA